MDSLFLSHLSFFPFYSSSSPFELDEHETFTTVTHANANAKSKSIATSPRKTHVSPFQEERNLGILVALPEGSDPQSPKIVLRKPLFIFRSMLYRSAPVNVPARMRMHKRGFEEEEDEDENGKMMLPSYEIVDRAKKKEGPWVASSVLEGVGRRLKGRDQICFRNAVFRKTGYLDGHC